MKTKLKQIINFIILIVVGSIIVASIGEAIDYYRPVKSPKCTYGFGVAVTFKQDSSWNWKYKHITPVMSEICDGKVIMVKMYNQKH